MHRSRPNTIFHHRFYRYVRMMLRRYPKMRWELYGWSSNPGVDAICGNTSRERILALEPFPKSPK